MPFGEIVCGSPGSGKSTYCYGKHQLFTALNRPISIVNLDPANDSIPYPCAIDIASLITLQDVMAEHGLGPNGGLLYCMEYLEANFDWLEERLRALGRDAYVLFDLPGQVELSTNHDALKNIVEKLAKRSGFRVRSRRGSFPYALPLRCAMLVARRGAPVRRALRDGRGKVHLRAPPLPAHDAAPRAPAR
jgi:GTPase SAR1 family protein